MLRLDPVSRREDTPCSPSVISGTSRALALGGPEPSARIERAHAVGLGLGRVALDLALAHEHKGEEGAGEADQAPECEHVVQLGEKPASAAFAAAW